MMAMSNELREGSGVRAGRARTRRRWGIIAAVVAAGAVLDVVLIPMLRPAPAGEAMLPPAAAILGALVFVLLINAGCWVYLRVADELEQKDNLVAFTAGFFFNISAYIAWFLLWAGGIVPPPQALFLFVGTFVVAALAYAVLKVRRLAL